MEQESLEPNGTNGRLSATYDRFARTFGAPRWDRLPGGIQQAITAATAQLDHEDDSEPLLSVEQVAARMGVSTDVVYGALKTGALRGARLGAKLWRIRESDLWSWFDRNRKRTRGPARGR